MKNINVVRHKQRLDHLFEQTRLLSENFELQSHWAKYLCILVSGFLESSIRAIYIEYARTKAAPEVGNFVESRLRGFQNTNMERILQLANSFSPQWEAELRNMTKDELKDAVDSIVAIRNDLAHGGDTGITYARISDYYQKAIQVVELIEAQCNPI
jgi:hypothetical protein